VAASYDLNMMGLVPIEDVANWLWWWFSGVDLGLLSDGSNVPQINNPDIAPLPVPLPPSMEQVAIISSLVEQVESVAALATATEALQKQSAAQRQNLLRAAFRGELVPQDPNDEPASVLLQRVRAERNTNPKPTKVERETRKAKGAA
jgi:type I restriction enzyme S subunit